MKSTIKKMYLEFWKYFRFPIKIISIGLMIQMLYKFTFIFINPYIGISIGVLSMWMIGTGAVGLIYMLAIMWNAEFSKENI